MIKKYFNRKIIVLLTVFILALLITSIIYAYPVIDIKNAEKTIVNEFNNGTKLSGDGATRVKDGFEYFKNGKYEIVLSQFDLSKPLYCFINSSNNSPNLIYVQSISMLRTGYDGFEVVSYGGGVTRSLTFSEIVSVCRKGDITKQNLPSEKFTIIPKLTPEEIENNKKQQQIQKEIEQQSEVRKNQTELQKVQGYEEEIKLYQKYLDTGITKEGKPLTQEQITEINNLIKLGTEYVENYYKQNPQDKKIN